MFFFRRYEETLQCLHETLKNCDNQETTSYIQDRLSASWVLQVNRLCNINMENNQPNKYKTSSEPQDRVPNSEKMEKHPTVLNIDHFTIEMDFGRRVMGDNRDITRSITRQDSVADSKEHIKLDKTENKNDLNYKPNDAFVNKQTNINVYFNPLEVKNEKISIKDFQSGKMVLTFEQSDPQKNTKWKTKIGQLVFQQETL